MDVILINPPPTPGGVVSRSYAGGFGVLDTLNHGTEEGETDVLLPPVELAVCASALQQRSHTVAIHDFSVDDHPRGWIERVSASAAHVVVSLVSLPAYRQDCCLLRQFKDHNSDTRLFLLTAVLDDGLLKEMLSLSAAEKIVHPDGIPRLAEILEGRETANTAWLDDQGGLRKGSRHIPDDLDCFPSPAWALLRHPGYRYRLTGFPERDIMAFGTSVGCPYPCSYYCPYPLAQGSRVRTHSVDRVVAELATIERLGVAGVVFTDPVFTIDSKRTLEICERIISAGIRLRWACETRIDRLDFELMRSMQRAGCVGIEVGVESGDPVVLAEQAKSGLTLEAVRRFKEWADALGIGATFLFLIGLPMETRASIGRSLRFIRDLGANPDQINVAVITPYPGTRLHADAIARNWIVRPETDFSGYTPVMRTDNLSVADITYAKRLADELLILLRNDDAHGGGPVDGFFRTLESWIADGRPLDSDGVESTMF